MLDTSAGANQLAEPGWYFNQDIPESEWMAQSSPCSDTVTPGDSPEFELCGEPDPEGIRLYWGIDNPTETRGFRLRRGAQAVINQGDIRATTGTRTTLAPSRKETLDRGHNPGADILLPGASARRIGAGYRRINHRIGNRHLNPHPNRHRRPPPCPQPYLPPSPRRRQPLPRLPDPTRLPPPPPTPVPGLVPATGDRT